MTLFTTRKRNTVEWPNYIICKIEYNFFSGIHPQTLFMFHSALHLRPSLVANRMYATIGLRIFVSENEIYITIVLGIFVLENYTWPLPRNDPEGMDGYIQRT